MHVDIIYISFASCLNQAKCIVTAFFWQFMHILCWYNSFLDRVLRNTFNVAMFNLQVIMMHNIVMYIPLVTGNYCLSQIIKITAEDTKIDIHLNLLMTPNSKKYCGLWHRMIIWLKHTNKHCPFPKKFSQNG